MKKTISIIICLIIFLWFGLLSSSQYQQSQKEIVRNRFLENKSLADFFFLWKSFSRTKESIKNPLSTKIMNSNYFDWINNKIQYLLPWFLIATSPDYKEIIETGLYLEWGPIWSGGFYNFENLTDSMESFVYNYDIETIKVKWWNKYDVCISGAFAYSAKINNNTNNMEISRWPYKISTCYPFILENDTIVIDNEELAKTQNKQ